MPGRYQVTLPVWLTRAKAGSNECISPTRALYGVMSGSQISDVSGSEKDDAWNGFFADFMLIWNNSTSFNQPNTGIWRIADDLGKPVLQRNSNTWIQVQD